MKTLKDWFDEYSVSHQNLVNKKIHYICVPLIFFSIVGLLMSIPNPFLVNIPLWAIFVISLAMLFYVKLSFNLAIKMIFFSFCCLIGNQVLMKYMPFSLWQISLFIFILAWIGQFYGHKIEGKKPSFLKDLQFLLVGPAWVMHSIFK